MKINSSNNFNNIKLNKNNTKQAKVSFAGNNTNLNNNSKKELKFGDKLAVFGVFLMHSIFAVGYSYLAKSSENIKNKLPENKGMLKAIAPILFISIVGDIFLLNIRNEDEIYKIK